MSAGNKRRILYVFGLESSVDEAILHAAFIPFGNIKEVVIPKVYPSSNSDFNFSMLLAVVIEIA